MVITDLPEGLGESAVPTFRIHISAPAPSEVGEQHFEMESWRPLSATATPPPTAHALLLPLPGNSTLFTSASRSASSYLPPSPHPQTVSHDLYFPILLLHTHTHLSSFESASCRLKPGVSLNPSLFSGKTRKNSRNCQEWVGTPVHARWTNNDARSSRRSAVLSKH